MKPAVIQFNKTDDSLCLFLQVEESPYTIAKVMKFTKRNTTMEDFIAKPVNYLKVQVPGFRIFLIHAGFIHKPPFIVPDETIQRHLEIMAQWYLENKTKNKRERNNYLI